MMLPCACAAALRLVAASAVLLVVLGGCSTSTPPDLKAQQRGMTKDVGGIPEEKAFKEAEITLPPYPQNAALLEFLPRRNSANHFYIDRDSISIGPDRVVRYSTLIKSPSGVVNTSYEGLRCKTSEYKVYAFGTDGGEWAKVPDAQWRNIPRLSPDFRFALYKDYFCDIEAIAGRNESDLIARLAGNPLNNASLRNR